MGERQRRRVAGIPFPFPSHRRCWCFHFFTFLLIFLDFFSFFEVKSYEQWSLHSHQLSRLRLFSFVSRANFTCFVLMRILHLHRHLHRRPLHVLPLVLIPSPTST